MPSTFVSRLMTSIPLICSTAVSVSMLCLNIFSASAIRSSGVSTFASRLLARLNGLTGTIAQIFIANESILIFQQPAGNDHQQYASGYWLPVYAAESAHRGQQYPP